MYNINPADKSRFVFILLNSFILFLSSRKGVDANFIPSKAVRTLYPSCENNASRLWHLPASGGERVVFKFIAISPVPYRYQIDVSIFKMYHLVLERVNTCIAIS